MNRMKSATSFSRRWSQQIEETAPNGAVQLHNFVFVLVSRSKANPINNPRIKSTIFDNNDWPLRVSEQFEKENHFRIRQNYRIFCIWIFRIKIYWTNKSRGRFNKIKKCFNFRLLFLAMWMIRINDAHEMNPMLNWTQTSDFPICSTPLILVDWITVYCRKRSKEKNCVFCSLICICCVMMWAVASLFISYGWTNRMNRSARIGTLARYRTNAGGTNNRLNFWIRVCHRCIAAGIIDPGCDNLERACACYASARWARRTDTSGVRCTPNGSNDANNA